MNVLFFIIAIVAFLRNEDNEYVTSADAEEQGIPSTGKHVLRACLVAEGEVPDFFEADETDESAAMNAIDWIRGLPEEQRDGSTQSSRYLKKLHKAATATSVGVKDCNMLASLPRAYFQTLARREEGSQFAESVHVGTVGAEYTGALTVVGSRKMYNKYNPSRPNFLHRFVDPKGNLLVWWTTSEKQMAGISEDAEIILTGQVKDHGTYEGTDQTVLRRCSISKV